jgi:multidrug efflux pump subunit AcrA (membrane-fusion protein)
VVAAVGYTAGSKAGSTGISIVGPGGATVTVQVPVTSISRVAVGQQVNVTPPGSIVPVPGTVQQISLLPNAATTTSTVTTFPVVVAVARPAPTLASGARATASILLGSATGVLTVPNSAITTISTTTGVVTVVAGGTTTRTPVTLGAVGETRTQITKGLKVGQHVLLADPSQAVPTSSTTTTRLGGAGGLGGTGGFGGGTGGFGGGFGGGGTGGGGFRGGAGTGG